MRSRAGFALWNDTIGLTTLGRALPEGLSAVPLADMPPSRLVVAWNSANASPLIRSFAHIAAATYHSAQRGKTASQIEAF